MFVEQLPIPAISTDIQMQLVLLIEKLSASPSLKKQIEQKIDDVVFSLYNITPEEKQLIYKDAFINKSISSEESLNIS
jgi:hypothetical protein